MRMGGVGLAGVRWHFSGAAHHFAGGPSRARQLRVVQPTQKPHRQHQLQLQLQMQMQMQRQQRR